jgi:NADH-quinone oxidoreductase B subunit
MNVIVSSVDFLVNWGRSNAIWPLTFATSCCGIEMISTTLAKFDIARFGSELFRASPRQADLMIVAGTISHRKAAALVRLYEQMPEPKYVLAMGACTVTGGMYENDCYAVVRGVDRLVPVDVYLPGCPPRPEALLDAFIQLQKKMRTETVLERKSYLEAHRPRVRVPETDDEELALPLEGIDVVHWGVKTEADPSVASRAAEKSRKGEIPA